MKKKWIGIIGAVVIVMGFSIIGALSKSGNEVTTSSVSKGDMFSYVEEIAEAKLTNETVVYAVAGGLCTTVPVEIGQEVKVGQVLLTLDPQPIALQIQESEAQLKGAQAKYKAALEPAKATDVAKLKSLLKSAQLAYDEAKASASANKSLYEAGAISKEDYDQVLTDLAAKEALLLTAKSNESISRSGITDNEKIQLQSQIDVLQSRLELYQSQLQNLSYTAPQNGVILSKHVEAGSYIQPGQKLIEIGDPKTLYFISDLLVEDMKGIQEGTTVRLFNQELGLSGLKDLTGKVTRVAPVAFSKLSDLGILQKRVQVEITLDRQVPELKSGYDVTAHFILEEKQNVLFVPESAVFDNAGIPSVFVIEQGKAVLKGIETGIREEERIEVIKGLLEGDVVIQSPDSTLVEGAKVQIKVK